MRPLPNSRVPLRTCVGCRTTRPSSDLVRVACDANGDLVISRTAPGRGAWVCAISPEATGACLRAGVVRGGFARAFRRSIDAGAAESVIQFMHQTSLI